VGLRAVLHGASPLAGVAAGFGVTICATLFALVCLPKGRAALHDLKNTFFLLVARRAA
jgi:hypothetical protein